MKTTFATALFASTLLTGLMTLRTDSTARAQLPSAPTPVESSPSFPAPTPSETPEILPDPEATEAPSPSPTPDPEETSCSSDDDPEATPSPSPAPSVSLLETTFVSATSALTEDAEVYKYEGPTTDYTGQQILWEKVYKGEKCIKQKKFYYCAACSDLNDEHPSIWIDPATAKFIFEPPYALGGQKTLGEVNFLTLDMGAVGRYKTTLNPGETNEKYPLPPPADQRTTIVQATIPAGKTPMWTYQIP